LGILPHKGNLDHHYYLDGLKVNGKRKRLFFTTEAEAKAEGSLVAVTSANRIRIVSGGLTGGGLDSM
jgi:hypothetical protein